MQPREPAQGEERDKAAQRLQQKLDAQETARHNKAQEYHEAQTLKENAREHDLTMAKAGLKPVDEQEFSRLAAEKDFPETAQRLKDLQSQVGFSAVSKFLPENLQFGKQRELSEAQEAAAPALVGVLAPSSKGLSPEVLKIAKNQLNSEAHHSIQDRDHKI